MPIEAVEPDKLETLYQSCLDTNEPTPRIFSRIVAKSLVDMDMVGNWLVSSFQIQNESTDNPRLLPLQTCLRLALAPNAKFLKLHYKVTCKSAVSRKRVAKSSRKCLPKRCCKTKCSISFRYWPFVVATHQSTLNAWSRNCVSAFLKTWSRSFSIILNSTKRKKNKNHRQKWSDSYLLPLLQLPPPPPRRQSRILFYQGMNHF